MKSQMGAMIAVLAVALCISVAAPAQDFAMISGMSAQPVVVDDESDVFSSITADLPLRFLSQKGLRSVVRGVGEQINSGTFTGRIIDVLKAIKAAGALVNKSFNPEALKVNNFTIENDYITVYFDLGSEVAVRVSVSDYSATFDKSSYILSGYAMDVRNNMSRNMGTDLSEQHINSITPIYYRQQGENEGVGLDPYINFNGTYIMSASSGQYDLVLSYQTYGLLEQYTTNVERAPEYTTLYDTVQGIYTLTTMRLQSFVDRNTGVNLVSRGARYLNDVLNPTYDFATAWSWKVSEGSLILYMDRGYSPFTENFTMLVPVSVDLATGQASIEESALIAVKNARNEVAEKLGILYEDVHVNSIGKLVSLVDTQLTYSEASYDIEVEAGDFHMNFTSRNGVLTLNSLIKKMEGIDLYKNARDTVMNAANPDSLTLQSWSFQNGSVKFVFAFPDGSETEIFVKIEDGSVMWTSGMEDLMVKSRENVLSHIAGAEENGISLKDIHVNGIKFVNGKSGQNVLLNMNISGKYDLVLEEVYLEYRTQGDGELAQSFSPRQRHYILREFKYQGSDFVAQAMEKTLSLLNPEDGSMSVLKWTLNGDTLQLSLVMNNEYELILAGSDITVTVGLESGEISIDQKIVDMVIGARAKTAHAMQLDMSEVHVNGLTMLMVLYEQSLVEVDDEYPYQGPIYNISVSAGDFNMQYVYYTDSGKLVLTSLVREGSNVQLVNKAAEAGQRYVDNFSGLEISNWKYDAETGCVNFAYAARFSAEGNNRWAKITVDAVTGDPIHITSYYSIVTGEGEEFTQKDWSFQNGEVTETVVSEGKKLWNGEIEYMNTTICRYEGGSLKSKTTENISQTVIADDDEAILATVKTTVTENYDNDGNVISESFSQYTTNNGTGAIMWTCESNIEYNEYGDINKATVFTKECDENGVIQNMEGLIMTDKDTYLVTYDIDDAGNVTGTHVTDNDGNTVDYEGFIHPEDINMDDLQASMDQQKDQNQMNDANQIQNNDATALIEVLNQVQAAGAEGITFVPNMTYNTKQSNEAMEQ